MNMLSLYICSADILDMYFHSQCHILHVGVALCNINKILCTQQIQQTSTGYTVHGRSKGIHAEVQRKLPFAI